MKRIALIGIMLPLSLIGQVRFDQIFSDHMVLQAGKPFHITGKGIPGHPIKLTFQHQKQYHTTVDADSNWACKISPQKPSVTSFDIIASEGIFQAQVHDIVFGDVWLCAGQSNMEFPLSGDKYVEREKSTLGDELLRFYNPTYIGKDLYGKPYSDSMKSALKNGQFYTGSWERSTNNGSLRMSAIGYYLGKTLSSQTHRPMGIINISVGGSPIESWMSQGSLLKSDAFSSKADSNWITNDALPVWIRQRAIENMGKLDKNGDHAFKPGYIYGNGVERLSKLPIKGIVWYQGESNAQELPRVIEYPELLKSMINDYRKLWSTSDLPFYIIQLSSIDTIGYKSHYWPMFRQLQFDLAGKENHIGIVPTHDIGNRNNVHPNDKKTVADRLSSIVLRNEYHLKKIKPGPTPLKAVYRKQYVEVYIKNSSAPLKTLNDQAVKGFSFDGIHEVEARIKNNTIFIQNVSAPEYIYYSISPFSEANVMDGSGNPLPAFRMKVK